VLSDLFPYYVYVYLDSRRFGHYSYQNHISFLYEPFYVGKGTKYRWKPNGHILNYNHPTSNKIKKIGCCSVLTIREFFPTEQEAFDREIELIAIIGRKDLGLGPLLNLTDGGDGTCEENKQKISNALKAKYTAGAIKITINDNRPKTPWNKGKRGLQVSHNKGKKFSKETCKKISDSRKLLFKNGYVNPKKGKYLSDSTKEKLRKSKMKLPIEKAQEIQYFYLSNNYTIKEVSEIFNMRYGLIYAVLKNECYTKQRGD